MAKKVLSLNVCDARYKSGHEEDASTVSFTKRICTIHMKQIMSLLKSTVAPHRLIIWHGHVFIVTVLRVRTLPLLIQYQRKLYSSSIHVNSNGALIEGITACGRATSALLHMNDAERVAYRMGLVEIGHYPTQ